MWETVGELRIEKNFEEELVSAGGCWCVPKLKEALNDLKEGHFEETVYTIDGLTELAWEKLHSGYWKDVPQAWRDLYSICNLVLALILDQKGDVETAISKLDMGLLMGGPKFKPLLQELAQKIHSHYEVQQQQQETIESVNVPKLSGKKRKRTHDMVLPEIDSKFSIERIKPPSLLKFMMYYMKEKKPVIITDLMSEWPATQINGEREWRNFSYFKRLAGLRTVPIEIGKNYIAKGWGQTLMPLSKFIDEYILQESEEIGYLAQTQLFDQIPELKQDIKIPDYCTLGETEKLIIHSWFGPKGTISPTHHDRYHNLLSQVFGSKYIRIYDTNQTPYLYPHQDKILFNTSQVDVEHPDLEHFPLFSNAQYTECILHSGEMLYIPPQYWHYVRSLEISFSVSFWWE